MHEMTRLLCVGHSTIDTIYQVGAIPSTLRRYWRTLIRRQAGDGSERKRRRRTLGRHRPLLGRVGDDALGERIVALLEAEGVQTAVARRIARAQSPCTAVLVDDRGERLVCTYSDPALDADATWLPIALLALAIGERRAVADAAAFANAAAALKCTRFGGRLGTPVRAEVEALLRSARGE